MNILIKEIEKSPKFLEYNECVKNKISPIELLQNHSGDADP